MSINPTRSRDPRGERNSEDDKGRANVVDGQWIVIRKPINFKTKGRDIPTVR
jgi:hypothetical protein